MTNTVRHEWPGEIVLDHCLFAHVFHNLMLTQQLRDALMELNVIIHVAGTGFHGTNKRQLLIVHVFNQLREIGVSISRPGTGQVSRITVVLSAGIKQEAAHFRRNLMVQFGVVKNRSMLIQRDNIAVWHVGITVAGRGQVRLVDIEFAHAGLERLVRGTMAIHRRFLRFTHAVKFVIGFVRAVVMQEVEHPFRVEFVRGNIQTQCTLRNRANIGDIAACSR